MVCILPMRKCQLIEDSFGRRIRNLVIIFHLYETHNESNIFRCVGFAFIYMEDERDAEDAIRALDRSEFGRKGRRLRVEWTKVMHWYC